MWEQGSRRKRFLAASVARWKRAMERPRGYVRALEFGVTTCEMFSRLWLLYVANAESSSAAYGGFFRT